MGAGILILALALLPLRLMTLIIGAGLVLLLPLLDPVFGLYMAVLSVPVQELVQLPGGLTCTQAAMGVAVFAWSLRALAHPERRIVAGRLVLLWGALLWALLLSTSFTPYSRSEAIKETLRWTESFLIWLLAANTLQRRWHVAGLLVCLLLAPVAEAAIGLAQFVSGTGPPSFRVAPGLPFVRAYGTIGQPNSFAGYLNMAWPLALTLAVAMTMALWRNGGWRARAGTAGTEAPPYRRGWGWVGRRASDVGRWLLVLGSWFLVLVLLVALVASFSRGAWVGAALGALGMALALGRRSRRWAIAALGVGALAIGLGVGLLPASVGARLASISRYLTLFDAGTAIVTPENYAVVERMAQLQAGWRMFLSHPLIGVGPGNYTRAYPAVAVGTWYASRGHAHNYYLHMAAEAGIAGFLAYAALLAGMVYQAIVTLRRTNRTFWHSVAIGCCGIIAGVAGHDLFENLHVLSLGIQLAASWGLLTALERQSYRMRWNEDRE